MHGKTRTPHQTGIFTVSAGRKLLVYQKKWSRSAANTKGADANLNENDFFFFNVTMESHGAAAGRASTAVILA